MSRPSNPPQETKVNFNDKNYDIFILEYNIYTIYFDIYHVTMTISPKHSKMGTDEFDLSTTREI